MGGVATRVAGEEAEPFRYWTENGLAVDYTAEKLKRKQRWRRPMGELFVDPETRRTILATAGIFVGGASIFFARRMSRGHHWLYGKNYQPRSAVKGSKKFSEGGFQPKMDMKEAAQILGVKENAKRKEVGERYRKLMQLNHPDAGGSPLFAIKINEAKELLQKGAKVQQKRGNKNAPPWSS